MLAGILLAGVSPAAAQALNQRAVLAVVARMYGFDPDLLIAIAKVESAGNANAVSPKGAQGLMQLMPATAERYGVTDPFDPVENALGAARFLDHLRRWRLEHPEIDIRIPEMLAAYNAGEGRGGALWRGAAVRGDARVREAGAARILFDDGSFPAAYRNTRRQFGQKAATKGPLTRAAVTKVSTAGQLRSADAGQVCRK